MSKRGEQNLGGLLALLLGGGMQYKRYKDRRKREGEDEKLRQEEQAQYEAELERRAEQEAYRRAQTEGATQRGMEEAGYTQRDTPALTGSPASMAGFASAVQGSTGYADQPGKYWDKPPEPEYREIPGLVHLGEGEYRNDPNFLSDFQKWQMAQEDTPKPPTPLSDRDRMNYIMEGWTPEENVTTYDLQTQQPMVGGQPRPAVAGLVAPAMQEPPVDPNPITFSGAQVVSLAAKAADPFTGGSAIYNELGNAMNALSGLSGAGAGTTGAISLVDILADYPEITLTTADLNVLEQILQSQGVTAVRHAIETELR